MKKIFFAVLTILLASQLVSSVTEACQWNQIEKSVLNQIENKLNYTNCIPMTEDPLQKTTEVGCQQNQKMIVSYANDSIYFLSRTITKYPFLTQCWVDGSIDKNSCGIQLENEKCQTWDLRQ